jgi:hypothetical protein
MPPTTAPASTESDCTARGAGDSSSIELELVDSLVDVAGESIVDDVDSATSVVAVDATVVPVVDAERFGSDVVAGNDVVVGVEVEQTPYSEQRGGFPAEQKPVLEMHAPRELSMLLAQLQHQLNDPGAPVHGSPVVGH